MTTSETWNQVSIRELMTENGWTARELADKAFVSEATVNKWIAHAEINRTTPDRRSQAALTRIAMEAASN